MKAILFICLLHVCCFSHLFPQQTSQPSVQHLEKGQGLIFISDFQFDMTVNEQIPAFVQNQSPLSYHNMTTGLKLGYGHMFDERLMVGGKVGYLGNFRLIDKVNFRFSPIHGLTSDLLFRYYFSQSRLNPFVELGMGMQFQLRTLTNQLRISGFSQEVKYGLLFHVNEKIGLELSNSIRHTTFNDFATGSLIIIPQRISTLNPSFGIVFPV
ncbi:MAG: hypothetical protein AAF587_04330 [Bacteroidota bacterium]